MGLTANVADIADIPAGHISFLRVVAFLAIAYAAVLVEYQHGSELAPVLPPLDTLAASRQKQAQEKAAAAVRNAFATYRVDPNLLSQHEQQIVANVLRAARKNAKHASDAIREAFRTLSEKRKQATKMAASASANASTIRPSM